MTKTYFYSLQKKINKYEKVYRNSPRIAAFRMAIWNLFQIFRKHPKEKKRLFFIHCRNSINTGDMNCTPYLYFKDIFNRASIGFFDIINVDYNELKKDDVVIFGGGGLLNNNLTWNKKINELLKKNKNVIGWGLGFNTHYDQKEPEESINFKKFKLITNRDLNHPSNLPFLPCVSCMMPQLDKKYSIKRKIGIIEHKDFPIELNFERKSNKEKLEDIIEFIGSSEIIITNGYHAMYWSTLMGKKVILYKPFSCRYDYFKYPPVRYSGNLEEDIKNAKAYPNAKKECRELTLKFFNKVKKILKKNNVL